MKYCPKCASELTRSEIDGKTRLTCPSPSCDYVFWDNPIPVVAALVEHDDRVLLVRNKGWPEKMFGLITGFLEREETPEAGILREVKEELGLEGEIDHFIGYYPFFAMNQIILAFHVRARGTVVLGDEIAEVKPLKPEKLRPWPFGTGLAVRDWLEERKSKT